MNIPLFIIYLVLTFLWAGIPTGYLLVRIVKKTDIRSMGSGNIGATNVKRILGWKGFIAVLLLDAVKGAFPLVLWLLIRDLPYPRSGLLEVIIAAVTIAGNIFTPWLGFKGGKGMATSLGCLAALCPVPLLIGAAVFLVTLVASNYVSLASIVAAGLFPVIVFILQKATRAQDAVPLLVFAIILALLLIARHRENITRLARGEENKFFSKKPQNT